MPGRTTRRGPLWPAALPLAVAVALVVASVAGATGQDRGRVGAPARLEPIALRPPLPVGDATAAPVRPTRLRIPAAGVDTPLVPLGLRDDGAMEVPDDPRIAGWYELGPLPGEPGPAVIAGHVDSRTGPGVFFALRHLEPGDRVTVERDDGTWHVFAVTAVERHPKTALPVERIWAPSERPVLRLVTCGGVFDRATRHYTDNLVVFAEPVTSTAPQASLRDV